MLECPAMRRRVPALVLLLYVALDFANPLMPGAVSFDAETSVEAVRPSPTLPTRRLAAPPRSGPTAEPPSAAGDDPLARPSPLPVGPAAPRAVRPDLDLAGGWSMAFAIVAVSKLTIR